MKWRQGEFVSQFALVGNPVHIITAYEGRARRSTRKLADGKQNTAFIVRDKVAVGNTMRRKIGRRLDLS